MHGSNLVDIFVEGTWFVDVLCRNSVRGSSAVTETVKKSGYMGFACLEYYANATPALTMCDRRLEPSGWRITCMMHRVGW